MNTGTRLLLALALLVAIGTAVIIGAGGATWLLNPHPASAGGGGPTGGTSFETWVIDQITEMHNGIDAVNQKLDKLLACFPACSGGGGGGATATPVPPATATAKPCTGKSGWYCSTDGKWLEFWQCGTYVSHSACNNGCIHYPDDQNTPDKCVETTNATATTVSNPTAVPVKTATPCVCPVNNPIVEWSFSTDWVCNGTTTDVVVTMHVENVSEWWLNGDAMAGPRTSKSFSLTGRMVFELMYRVNGVDYKLSKTVEGVDCYNPTATPSSCSWCCVLCPPPAPCPWVTPVPQPTTFVTVIVPVTVTPKPTMAGYPQTPPTATPKGPITAAGCISPEELGRLTGNTEPGFWVQEPAPDACAFEPKFHDTQKTTVTCPMGVAVGQFVCTFNVPHPGGNDLVVHEGVGQSSEVWGVTVRMMFDNGGVALYPNESVCTVWVNERKFSMANNHRTLPRFQAVPDGVQFCTMP